MDAARNSVGTDYSFIKRELEKAGYFTDEERGDQVSDSVLALFAVLDGRELDRVDRETVARLFASLVEKDGNLGVRSGPRSEWKQLHLGEVPYGTTVRVKPDAYDTPAGSKHNGLTGTFAAARGGRVFIEYHGRVNGLGHEHHPDKVEYLWRA